MARRLRLEFSGALYLLSNQGDRGRDIVHDDSDRQAFVRAIGEVCGKTGWAVHAFCVLSDHFHLVIETPLPNLVTGMKWLLGTYTSRMNRRHDVRGHVFSGRYRSLIVDPDGDYLRHVCDYVHFTPLRAGLVSRGGPIRSFPWSSFPLYLQPPAQRPAWLKTERLLDYYDQLTDTPVGRAAFERRVQLAAGLAESAERPEFTVVQRGWFYGSENFRRELLQRMAGGVGPWHYGSEVQEVGEARAERIVQEATAGIGWGERELKDQPKGCVEKLKIAMRLRTETSVTLQWIADRLHMGTRTYLSHLLYWQRRRAHPRPGSTTEPKAQESGQSQDTILRTDPYHGESLFDPTFD